MRKGKGMLSKSDVESSRRKSWSMRPRCPDQTTTFWEAPPSFSLFTSSGAMKSEAPGNQDWGMINKSMLPE